MRVAEDSLAIDEEASSILSKVGPPNRSQKRAGKKTKCQKTNIVHDVWGSGDSEIF